jgi:hypothetical protein
MRTLGAVLVVLGIVGFVLASDQIEKMGPPAYELELGEYLRHPTGRMELLKYGAAVTGAVGLLLALYPKGR